VDDTAIALSDPLQQSPACLSRDLSEAGGMLTASPGPFAPGSSESGPAAGIAA